VGTIDELCGRIRELLANPPDGLDVLGEDVLAEAVARLEEHERLHAEEWLRRWKENRGCRSTGR